GWRGSSPGGRSTPAAPFRRCFPDVPARSSYGNRRVETGCGCRRVPHGDVKTPIPTPLVAVFQTFARRPGDVSAAAVVTAAAAAASRQAEVCTARPSVSGEDVAVTDSNGGMQAAAVSTHVLGAFVEPVRTLCNNDIPSNSCTRLCTG